MVRVAADMVAATVKEDMVKQEEEVSDSIIIRCVADNTFCFQGYGNNY